jgi:prepilin-type N-terminal cleavage/methylation domain-containing protein
MNSRSQLLRRPARAYTLIELLVVIAIIAVLASILLPAISGAKKKALIKKARYEMEQIRGAATAYINDYNGRMPVTQNAAGAGVPDFTYADGTLPTAQTYNSVNSEIVAILSALQQFRNGVNTVNLNHVRNPKQNRYLNGKDSDGDNTNPLPGIGLDGVYRDPWGNPYFITLDVNYDGICHDAMYKLSAVSYDSMSGTSLAGTTQTDSMNANSRGVRGEVIVWSAGPDGRYNTGQLANAGDNYDNILSWWDRQ